METRLLNLDGTPVKYERPERAPHKDTRTTAQRVADAYSRLRSNIFAVNKYYSSEEGENDLRVYGFYKGDLDNVFRLHTNRTPETISAQEVESLTIGTGCELIGGESTRGVLLFALKN